ncbi:CDC73-domain-containing protein [Meredithblackwellia eburnea MCA 4105]
MSSSSPDALLILRNSLSSSSTITLLALPPSEGDAPPSISSGQEVYSLPECTHIAFSSSGSSRPIFPKDTKTRYLAAVDGEPFDLQTLLFAYLQRDVASGEYLRQAREGNIGFVSVTDRRAIVEWLSGKSALAGPDGRIVPLPSSKRSADEDATDAPGQTSTEAGGPAVKKQRYVTNKEDLAKVKNLLALMDGPAYAVGTGAEIKAEKSTGAFRNRETVLRGDRLNSFESAHQLVGNRLKLTREEISRSQSSQAQASAPQPGKASRKRQQNPIIIISPSSTALITMHNVKSFLEDSIFRKSSDVAVSADGRRGTDDVVVVEHARPTSSMSSSGAGSQEASVKKQRYYVVDGVDALSKFGGIEDAWDRVVCVMTTGQEWQFRPYKWSEPKELFHHVKGIFVQWTNEAPNTKVRSWNVTELRIDPSKRHIDKSTVADFWRNLESWIMMNKPSLLQQ